MAMIKCKECGKELSDKAKTCPHCGVELNKKKRIIKTSVIVVGIVLVTLGIVKVFLINGGIGNTIKKYETKQEQKKEEQEQNKIKQNLLGKWKLVKNESRSYYSYEPNNEYFNNPFYENTYTSKIIESVVGDIGITGIITEDMIKYSEELYYKTNIAKENLPDELDIKSNSFNNSENDIYIQMNASDFTWDSLSNDNDSIILVWHTNNSKENLTLKIKNNTLEFEATGDKGLVTSLIRYEKEK